MYMLLHTHMISSIFNPFLITQDSLLVLSILHHILHGNHPRSVAACITRPSIASTLASSHAHRVWQHSLQINDHLTFIHLSWCVKPHPPLGLFPMLPWNPRIFQSLFTGMKLRARKTLVKCSKHFSIQVFPKIFQKWKFSLLCDQQRIVGTIVWFLKVLLKLFDC